MNTTRSPSLNIPLDRILPQRDAVLRGDHFAHPGHAHVFTILVPVDFSSTSDEAVALAARIGAPLHARFVLLHILPHMDASDSETDLAPIEERRNKALAKMSSMAGALRMAIRDAPYEIRIRHDCALAGIVHEALDTHADLIVLTRHDDPSDAAGWFDPAVEYAVHHAPCPVLLAPDWNDQ
jgi:Universal stress protein UspA and related nucleotide-binding proteins